MSDLVKKYQHYFNESVKLQETVNEQLAYITELEDAILELSEEPEINIPFTGKSISWGKEGELLKKADAKLAKLRALAKRTGSPKIEGILGEIEKQKGLDEMAMTIDRLDQHERKRKFTGDRGAIAYQDMSQEMESDKVHGLGGKVVGTLSPKGRVAHDLEGKKMGRVNVMGIVIPKGNKK